MVHAGTKKMLDIVAIVAILYFYGRSWNKRLEESTFSVSPICKAGRNSVYY